MSEDKLLDLLPPDRINHEEQAAIDALKQVADWIDAQKESENESTE